MQEIEPVWTKQVGKLASIPGMALLQAVAGHREIFTVEQAGGMEQQS